MARMLFSDPQTKKSMRGINHLCVARCWRRNKRSAGRGGSNLLFRADLERRRRTAAGGGKRGGGRGGEKGRRGGGGRAYRWTVDGGGGRRRGAAGRGRDPLFGCGVQMGDTGSVNPSSRAGSARLYTPGLLSGTPLEFFCFSFHSPGRVVRKQRGGPHAAGQQR